MLTREQIIERLKVLERWEHYYYDEGDGYVAKGMQRDEDGDCHHRDDILAIIKEAESA